MKKGQLTGFFALLVAEVLLFFVGRLYFLNHYNLQFAAMFFCAAVSVPSLVLAGYRRLGTAPAWLAMALAFPALYFGSGNAAITVLVWALCCGTPLAVSFFWARKGSLGALTRRALPASGLLWIGGSLLYCRLHLGDWSLGLMTDRLAYRYELMVEKLETVYTAFYRDELPEEILDAFQILYEQSAFIGFRMVTFGVFALVGSYFLGLFLADHSMPAEERRLGSWAVLLPTRGVSTVYMLAYIAISVFVESQIAVTLKAVFDLFGFFFVFAAVYKLLQFFRKKNMHPVLHWGLVFLLFTLAYFSAGDLSLSAYFILMMAGWWIVTTPPKIITHGK